MVDRIELADLVRSLPGEINRAWAEGQHDVVGFEAGPIEVELTTEVEVLQVQGKVAAKFWVEVGAEAGRTATSAQRIMLSMTPGDRRDPTKPLYISGKADPRERPPTRTTATLRITRFADPSIDWKVLGGSASSGPSSCGRAGKW